ncbi:MAG: heavy metal translocating P-type ATPase metal-binding domain-containing protein [candidate division Zixibacteria bacterium]|nr:heavy metal translocating P-type ATPase metal-binding domain-containing protein [candidate division Zixibacteria bacterium]
MAGTIVTEELACTHCGARCRDQALSVGGDVFCCSGCKAVYELLHSAELSAYYGQATPPGIKPSAEDSSRFAYLDDPAVSRKLVDFSDGETDRVSFVIPQIHCASCVWLLENLYRLNPGISRSQVNFLRREVSIQFDPKIVTLRQLVEQLAKLGYEPRIRLEHFERVERRDPRRSLYLKVGVAGFCFANIMLLSFPDYLNARELEQTLFPLVFRIAMVILALPVLFYSASDYFRSSFYSLRSRMINIDVPLALGMAALFGRSIYDITINAGPGFLDSFSGLVFFLLLGKLFQDRTYERLSFDRDYKAYFPASITRRAGDSEISVPVTGLIVGDRIIVRNQEIVPADSILISGNGSIDYSFVTGESTPRPATSGAMVYAGGRQVGTTIELEVVKEVSQSYLTSLWNSATYAKDSRRSISTVADRFGKYFTAAVILIAAATAIFWLRRDVDIAINAVTAVLIVACPCALALSSPFVLGTAMRILGSQNFFLKNAAVVEAMATADTIVFDKTGTLTINEPERLTFDGAELSDEEIRLIKSLARHSTHPASRRIDAEFQAEPAAVREYAEESGMGISGLVNGRSVRLGRYSWAVDDTTASANGSQGEGSVTYLAIDGQLRGKFRMNNRYRAGIEETIRALRADYSLAVLSGDNAKERGRLTDLFGANTPLRFDQSPHDKLNAVDSIQSDGRRVLMIGDGLNDAGALKAATVGIAVSDQAINFTPACDGILEASQLHKLNKFLLLARASRNLILASIAISIFYNVIGLAFAASGHLSPLVSAILMPVSSVSVVLFATLGTRLAARRIGVS